MGTKKSSFYLIQSTVYCIYFYWGYNLHKCALLPFICEPKTNVRMVYALDKIKCIDMPSTNCCVCIVN